MVSAAPVMGGVQFGTTVPMMSAAPVTTYAMTAPVQAAPAPVQVMAAPVTTAVAPPVYVQATAAVTTQASIAGAAFNAIDRNHDGQITRSEFDQALGGTTVQTVAP